MLIGIFGASACTNLPKSDDAAREDQQNDSVLEVASEQSRENALELAIDPNLPKQDLSKELLELLLISNLASYQGDWAQASSNALGAAQQSQDYRIARVATLLALRDNDYQTAVVAAELWLKLNSDSVDALNMLLISQVGSGQVDAALVSLAERRKELQSSADLEPVAEDADSGDVNLDENESELDRHIKQTAGLLVRQRNGDAAVEIAQHYVDNNPASAQVMLSAAYIAETFEKGDIAEQWVSNALTLRPDWDLAAQMKSSMLRRQGKNDERAQFIAEFVSSHPDSTIMQINHAAELASNKEYQAAFDVMQQVLISAPDDVSALSYAGALAQQLEKTELAKKYYRGALAQDPNNDDVRWSLARIAAVEKKYAKAEQLYGDVRNPESYISAQIQVANMRYHTKGLKYAVNTLRALEPQTEPQFIEIALTRHYLLMQDREYEEAFAYVNESLLYLPDNLDLIYARALVASEIGKITIAETDFRVIIQAQPENADALNALGYTLTDQTERHQEAKAYIERALALRPQDAHILDSMGWVAYRMKDFDKALEFLERAFAASPQIEIAAHLGEVLWEMGQRDKALQVWQDSYAEDADNPILNKTLKRYDVDFGAGGKAKPAVVRPDDSVEADRKLGLVVG